MFVDNYSGCNLTNSKAYLRWRWRP